MVTHMLTQPAGILGLTHYLYLSPLVRVFCMWTSNKGTDPLEDTIQYNHIIRDTVKYQFTDFVCQGRQ